MNEERIREAIRREADQQADDSSYALKRLMFKLICLAALGVAILSLWLYLAATTETVGVEILSIMGWVCVWEATSIAIMQRPELLRAKKNLERLSHAEIVFQIADNPETNTAD